MLELLSTTASNAIFALLEFYTIKRLLSSNEKIYKPKTILLLIILIIITTIFYSIEYKIESTIIIVMSITMVHKLIFNQTLSKTIVSCGIFLVMVCFGDLITSTFLMFFITVKELRACWYAILLSNIMVAAIVVLLSKNKVFSETAKQLINKYENKQLFSMVIYLVLTIIVVIVLFYNLSIRYGFNANYVITFVIAIIFFLLTIIFIVEKYNYEKLQNNYELLFDYVQNYEDKIEKEQLNRHEYKNQLAVLRGLVKNKQAKALIDEMIEVDKSLENSWNDQLSLLPKGGIKGLIYYKTVLCDNKKIKLTIDISPSVKKDLACLNENEKKTLTKLIGIYFDNAIEAADKTAKKLVTLEIYKIGPKLNFIFTNTFTDKDRKILDKKERGISSKGKGRGNGLYFANKIIKQNEILHSENIIINNFYVQKLIIEIKK